MGFHNRVHLRNLSRTCCGYLKMNIQTKKCKNCGENIRVTERSTRVFCSEDCRRAGAYEDKTLGLSAGTVGAYSELIASADLLRRGYEVYRAVSPTCSSDLVAIKDGKRLTIEVRTARRSRTGTLHYSTRSFRSDHYALVEVAASKVTYEPPL
jgi:hypothetical protein